MPTVGKSENLLGSKWTPKLDCLDCLVEICLWLSLEEFSVHPNLMPKSLEEVGWLFCKVRIPPGLFLCATRHILNPRQSWSSATVRNKSDTEHGGRRRKKKVKQKRKINRERFLYHLHAAEMKGATLVLRVSQKISS